MIKIKARNLDLKALDAQEVDGNKFTIKEMIDSIKDRESRDRKTGDVRLWNPKERKQIKEEG